jgi:nucleoside-diphosphate-sugar epimerase
MSLIAITGATGFVGSEVARAASRAGHDVVCLVRGEAPEERLARAGVRARVVPGDLADAAAIARLIAGAHGVVHLAAVVDPALQHDERAVTHVNRDLAVALARAARDAGARWFVFVSSIAAMGFWSGVATGRSPCRPETAYGRTKRDAEDAILALNTPDFGAIALRPPTVYGPGESYNFLSWVRAVDRGVFRLIGSGGNHFPLSTSENVGRAAVAAASGALSPGAYVVADGEAYTLQRIHRAILAALGLPEPRLSLPVAAARVAGALNEAVHFAVPAVPLLLSRARVRTLTVDQRFDVEPLLRRGVALDAPLEDWVRRTVEDQRARGLLGGSGR